MKTRRSALVSAALLMAVLAGCTKSYSIASISTSPPPASAVNFGTVLVVLPPDAIKEDYRTSSSGTSYVYTGVRSAYVRALSTKLRQSFADVKIGKDAGEAGSFDLVLFPSLVVDTKDRGFAGKAASVTFSLRVESKGQRVISEQSGQRDQRFMESGDKAFREASGEVLNTVVDAALADIAAERRRTGSQQPPG